MDALLLRISSTPLAHANEFLPATPPALDVVRLLVEKGAEMNKAKDDGATPLFYTCSYGHPDAVRLLVEMGAHI